MGRAPRRLRRFKRRGELPSDLEDIELGESVPRQRGKKGVDKEIATQLALDEVQRFKQKHQRLPKKKEYDSIAESIYAQLKDKEKRKKIMQRLERKKGSTPSERAGQRKVGRRKRRRPGEEAAAGAKESAFAELQRAAKGLSEEEIKGMSVEDLFDKEEKKAGKKPVAKQGEAEEEFSLGGLTDLEESSVKEEQQKCPQCGAQEAEIIFCPECGTAFCERCSKRVERLGKVRTLVCPGCGKKIKK